MSRLYNITCLTRNHYITYMEEFLKLNFKEFTCFSSFCSFDKLLKINYLKEKTFILAPAPEVSSVSSWSNHYVPLVRPSAMVEGSPHDCQEAGKMLGLRTRYIFPELAPDNLTSPP